MNKIKNSFQYCNSITEYSRYLTRVVEIGGIPLGGKYPIRVQSMTTTDTMDTKSTVDQSIKIIEAGSEYVRITAPSINEAKNLSNIKKKLICQGYHTPIIADIHFTPNAAIEAARIVEKIRINPGNFADKKKFEKFEISDEEYNLELERIYERFSPLVKICKENGTAMRIGTNHGSLSDRIMNKYGDSPLGMVESALEFIRMCEDHNFYNIVLSMKSSNPIIMVNAYRLLVNKMLKEQMNYPLHLGVTEAGEGMEGRVKSSIGIGSLLEDGIGDTIRVSLTENPEVEIPVAKSLVERYSNRIRHDRIEEININPINPFEYNSRNSNEVLNIGGKNVPRVFYDLTELDNISYSDLSDLGYTYIKNNDKWLISDVACDYIHIGNIDVSFDLPGTLGIVQPFLKWRISKKSNHYPLFDLEEYLKHDKRHAKLNFLFLNSSEISNTIISVIENDLSVVIILGTTNNHGLADQRRFFIKLMNIKNKAPVIIHRSYSDLSLSNFQLYSSTDVGGLLIDGIGDGISLSLKDFTSLEEINKISFSILQASRTRITKTEYISCPSCGRTQFDLQKTTAIVREKTSHLKGIKIAVMGCIVNGPGEMADADYGYVGTGKKVVSIYKGHNIIKRNIHSDDSIDELINIIKINGDWIEP